MHRKVAPMFAVVVALLGCSGGDGDGPLLLVRRDVNGVSRLVQVSVTSGRERDVLPGVDGRVGSVLVVDNGRAAFVTVDGELWRIAVGKRAPVRVPGVHAIPLDAADRAGRVISLGDGRLLLFDDKPHIEDLHAPAGSQRRNGDVSEDGRRVLISFGPDCARDAKPWECRLEVWGFDRDAPTDGWRRIAGGSTSAYNGRFVPGTDGRELVFHRVQPDATCPGPWACRKEDVVHVGFDGTDERVVRALSWTPRFSPDGRSLAVATTPEHQLAVGPRDGALTVIADDAMWAAAWSPDGTWVSYYAFGKSDDAGVVRRDGSARRTIKGRPAGWIAGELAGAPVDTKPRPSLAPGPEQPMNASFDDGAVELVAVALPERLAPHARFDVILRYRVVRRPSANWKAFVHFDNAGMRFQGDHELPRPTSMWSRGDEIEDRFTVTAGPAGNYAVFAGFFIGTDGAWKNIRVEAPTADANGRVRVGNLRID